MTTTDDRLAEHRDAGGPGRFEGEAFPAATSYVHGLTLEGGASEECGTVEYGPGWFGLVYLGAQETADVIALGWEPDVDGSPDDHPVAAIIREDDRGFVGATFYLSEDAAQAAWEECQAACDEADDEDHIRPCGDPTCDVCGVGLDDE